MLLISGCSDDLIDGQNSSQCQSGETWNPVQERCVSGSGDGSGDGTGDGSYQSCDDVVCGTGEACFRGTCRPHCDDIGDCVAGLECVDNACVDPDEIGDGDGGDGDGGSSCINFACDQVTCPAGQPSTSISGRVTIPSVTLPLADVVVYVPNRDVAPIVDGVSCERCEDQFSGSPLVQTTTDVNGEFTLENAPAGTNIPLVIQIGKWRRQVSVPFVDECQDNQITDESITRLPRNTQEGDMPRIAVTTGSWDAIECLIRKIGIDESEFTHESGDGRVNFFAGRGGTNSYQGGFGDGSNFTTAWDWWGSLDNLIPYDIILHSCEGDTYAGDKSTAARQALQDFTEMGGRVFLSHWHNIWLSGGPADFQSVANWGSSLTPDPVTGYIDDSFEKGEILRDWMFETGTTPIGSFPIHESRGTIASINTSLTQRWVWLQQDNRTQYFSFNSPVTAPGDEQCGRVVFSDIHVAAGDNSSPSHPYPSGCTSSGFTDQEKALVFMFFDLSACIIPDCERLTCDDFAGDCGEFADGCGGVLECGECCLELTEECTSDEECCDSLWCDDDTNRCTDRCRTNGERCTDASQCCGTQSCTGSPGNEGTCTPG